MANSAMDKKANAARISPKRMTLVFLVRNDTPRHGSISKIGTVLL
jgi:hypothetical protein